MLVGIDATEILELMVLLLDVNIEFEDDIPEVIEDNTDELDSELFSDEVADEEAYNELSLTTDDVCKGCDDEEDVSTFLEQPAPNAINNAITVKTASDLLKFFICLFLLLIKYFYEQ
jgi:hypothetical protein